MTFLQNSIFYSCTLTLKLTTRKTLLSSLRLWATVSACVHVQAVTVGNHTFLSGGLTVTSSVQISWKKFWVEKAISPAIKNWAEEISDILLSSEKGLREVSHKGGGSDPRDLRSFSVMCPQVVSVAVTSQSSLLFVCHSHQAGMLGGNLSPNHMIV